MNSSKKSKISSLIRGLSTDQKQAVADDLGITRSHLVRKSNPAQLGRCTVDEFEIIMRHLTAVYGAGVVDNLIDPHPKV